MTRDTNRFDETGAHDVNRRKFLAAGGGLAIALVALPTRVTAASEPLKIGCLGPFTGPASRTGANIRQGVEMALEDARTDGQVPVTIGNEKRDVSIVWVDDQSSPEKAVRALREAIDREGIKMLIGGWHSSVAMAVMDVGADAKIVELGDVGESQSIADKITSNPERYRGFFKSYPSPASESTLYGPPLNYFREKGLWRPKNLKTAVIVEDSDYGRSWGASLVGGLKSAGYDVAPFDVVSISETDFAPLMTKIKAQQASLVAMSTGGGVGFANFVKQFRQQNVKALLIAHGLSWFSDWYKLTGDASDYCIAMDSPVALGDWQTAWMKRFEAKYHEVPSITSSGLAYDYTRYALQMLNKAGTTDIDKLSDVILNTPYKGVWNYYEFAKGPGPNAVSRNEVMTGDFMKGFFFPMIQMMKGQLNVVWPLEYAKEKFTQPPWL